MTCALNHATPTNSKAGTNELTRISKDVSNDARRDEQRREPLN